MNLKERCFIVVPAFNEGEQIEASIKDLKNNGYMNIIVVDDGSKDNTFNLALNKGISVLRHIVNRGQGAALRTGIEKALEEGAEMIVTFDSDGQHNAEDIIKLIEPIDKKEVDVSLGSRFLDDKSNVPFMRKLFLKGGSLLFRIMYNAKLTDSHNGLRAFSNNAARKINFTQEGMEHASEIVELMVKRKLKYKEVPVKIQYTEYSLEHGQKTSNAFRIFLKMVINKILK